MAAVLDVCPSQVRCGRSRWNVTIRPRPSVESFKLLMILCCLFSVCQECVDGSLLSSVTLRSLKLLKPLEPFGY